MSIVWLREAERRETEGIHGCWSGVVGCWRVVCGEER